MQQRLWHHIHSIRWVLSLVMAGAVLALFTWLKLAPADSSSSSISAEATSEDANLTLNNFEYHDVSDGRTRWSLQASSARYFEEKRETVLSQVSAVFFQKNGDQVNLQGDTGILHNDSKDMEIIGNVNVNYGDGYRLLTDQLVYTRAKELIHTQAPVFMEGQGFILKGIGMRLEMENRTLSVLKHIETDLQGIVSFGEKREKAS